MRNVRRPLYNVKGTLNHVYSPFRLLVCSGWILPVQAANLIANDFRKLHDHFQINISIPLHQLCQKSVLPWRCSFSRT